MKLLPLGSVPVILSFMIPLQKLSKLPRSQRLRKAAKIVEEAERRFFESGRIPAEEAEYLGRLIEFLAGDENFSKAETDGLKAARENFVSADKKGNEKEIRRALSIVYQIILAETGRNQADWDFIESGGALDPSKRRPFPGMQVYLEDIRSPFNVGAMFRAAESFGAEKIWLSPLCADPRHKRAERTAMGCVDVLPWERLTKDPFVGPGEAGLNLENVSSSSFFSGPLFAMETGGIPLEDFHFPSMGTMIAGSEELGASPLALAVADASLGRVTIPVYGAKGSLNVSVAFGIVMQAWAAQLAKH